jgi:hypothetical protein
MNEIPQQQDETGLHKVMLLPHPETPCPAIRSIEVRVTLSYDGTLKLNYFLKGDIENLRIPKPTNPSRTDRLWEHTCFEAFLSIVGNTAYHEFNFAPSGTWAAYAFQRYREGGSQLEMATPRINMWSSLSCLELEVQLNLSSIVQIDSATLLRFGLSAVLETEDGHHSLWALHHPSGKPDFHHPEAFALNLKFPGEPPIGPRLLGSPD